MLHCFNFTVGQLKSRRQVDKNPALAFENDCNSRFRISIGFGFQNKGPAKIPPFARHKVRCYRQTTSTSLFPDDRADRLQELSVRRLQRWTWIGKDAKGFGVGIHWLPRRTQKNEAHPGGVYSFHADNIIVKYRNVVIDVADLTSRARPKLPKPPNSPAPGVIGLPITPMFHRRCRQCAGSSDRHGFVQRCGSDRDQPAIGDGLYSTQRTVMVIVMGLSDWQLCWARNSPMVTEIHNRSQTRGQTSRFLYEETSLRQWQHSRWCQDGVCKG